MHHHPRSRRVASLRRATVRRAIVSPISAAAVRRTDRRRRDPLRRGIDRTNATTTTSAPAIALIVRLHAATREICADGRPRSCRAQSVASTRPQAAPRRRRREGTRFACWPKSASPGGRHTRRATRQLASGVPAATRSRHRPSGHAAPIPRRRSSGHGTPAARVRQRPSSQGLLQRAALARSGRCAFRLNCPANTARSPCSTLRRVASGSACPCPA